MHLCKQKRYWIKTAYLFFCCVIGVITTFTIIKFIYKAHSGWFEKACFMGAVIKHGARAVTPSANSLFWKLESNAWEFKGFLIINKNDKALTYFWTKAHRRQLQHARSREKHSNTSFVLPYTSFVFVFFFSWSEHSQGIFIC